jgi:hypothetical protein
VKVIAASRARVSALSYVMLLFLCQRACRRGHPVDNQIVA